MENNLIRCPRCGSTDIAFVEAKDHLNEYICKKCGERFYEYGTSFPPFRKIRDLEKLRKEVV